MRALIIILIAVSGRVYGGDIDCEDVSSLDAVHAGIPVVKIAPKYPIKGTQKLVPGCAVLTFSLDRSAPSSTPKKIRVEYSSEKRFGVSAKTAFSKWLYINKNVPVSKRYYMVFHFEV